MKKLIALTLAVLAFSPAFAWHHSHCYHHHHHHHDGSGWGAVGVGLAAGVVGAALYNAVRPEPRVVVQPSPVVVQQPVVVPQPTVVQQPVVIQQPVQTVVQQPVVQQVAPAPVRNVWVEGAYVNQIQPDGTVQRVWNPGHYEQR